MSHLEANFVKPLSEFYGRNPFGPGFAKRLEPYAKTLNEEVLQSVATKLIERGGKSFPSLSQCRDALSRAEEFMSSPASTDARQWDVQTRDSAEWEAKKAAWKMCRCELGRQADREGWLTALIEFCMDRGRLPGTHEVNSVIAKARQTEASLKRLEPPVEGSHWSLGEQADFYRAAKNMRALMLARAHEDVFGFIDTRQAAE